MEEKVGVTIEETFGNLLYDLNQADLKDPQNAEERVKLLDRAIKLYELILRDEESAKREAIEAKKARREHITMITKEIIATLGKAAGVAGVVYMGLRFLKNEQDPNADPVNMKLYSTVSSLTKMV